MCVGHQYDRLSAYSSTSLYAIDAITHHHWSPSASLPHSSESNTLTTLSSSYLHHTSPHLLNPQVRDGWAGFSESADARKLSKAPLGVLQGMLALVFFTLFCVIFYPAKYGPPIAEKVNATAEIWPTNVVASPCHRLQPFPLSLPWETRREFLITGP